MIFLNIRNLLFADSQILVTRFNFIKIGGHLVNIEVRKYVDDQHLVSHIADPVLRQLLARRGVLSGNELDVNISSMLSPYDLKDIEKAADIICTAIIDKKRIMIAGDYDIDGMSGTALGVNCLKAFGVPKDNIFYHVPSRYEDGYGLSKKTVDLAIENSVDLIVTVDNGISAFEAVDYAVSSGIDIVVTDHHEVQEVLPNALAVVDPKRKDDTFESKHLSGVGVLFYVLIVTRAKLIEKSYFSSRDAAPKLNQFLDLVTIGTIGDVMSFDANNRRLIRAGLNRIQEGQVSLGIKAVLKLLNIGHNKVTPRVISFDICPRFNAATRIKLDNNPAIATLLSETPAEAEFYAKQLDMCNRRRMDHEKVSLNKAIAIFDDELVQNEKSKSQGEPDRLESSQILAIYEEASKAYARSKQDDVALAEEQFLDEVVVKDFDTPSDINSVVIYDPCFLTGLVGLVANRMKERYHRPCIIFGGNVGAGISGGKEMIENSSLSISRLIEDVKANPTNENLDKLSDIVSFKGDEAARPNSKGFDLLKNTSDVSVATTNLTDSKDNVDANFNQNFYMKINDSNREVNSIDDAYELSKIDGDLKIVGSARSIPGVDLMEVFNYIKSKEPDIFIACGGHAVAAGATIKARDFKRFKELFNEACSLVKSNAIQQKGLLSDGVLPENYYCLQFARDLELLGPWGKDFEEPKFHGIFTVASADVLANRHLKLRLLTANNVVIEAIKFRANAKEKSIQPNIKVKAFFNIGVDRYYSKERLVLGIESIEPA